VPRSGLLHCARQAGGGGSGCAVMWFTARRRSHGGGCSGVRRVGGRRIAQDRHEKGGRNEAGACSGGCGWRPHARRARAATWNDKTALPPPPPFPPDSHAGALVPGATRVGEAWSAAGRGASRSPRSLLPLRDRGAACWWLSGGGLPRRRLRERDRSVSRLWRDDSSTGLVGAGKGGGSDASGTVMGDDANRVAGAGCGSDCGGGAAVRPASRRRATCEEATVGVVLREGGGVEGERVTPTDFADNRLAGAL
jgi:hypothetical protein